MSDPGIARVLRGDPNEDSVLAFRLTAQHSKTGSDMGVLMIADGVGGAAAGEVASEMATQTIAQELVAALMHPSGGGRVTDEDIHDTLRAAISEANQQVIEYGLTHSLSPGTTVVLALLREGRLYIANVGDSRAYLYREGRTGTNSRATIRTWRNWRQRGKSRLTGAHASATQFDFAKPGRPDGV